MPIGAPLAIVDFAPRRFGAVRRQATLDTSTAVATAAPSWSRVLALGVPHGVPVIVFHDAAGDALYDEPGVEVDMGFELFADIADPVVSVATSPGGPALRGDHHGPHIDIRASHDAIRSHAAANGLRFAGPVVELHHWNDDPARRVTEIYYLLA